MKTLFTISSLVCCLTNMSCDLKRGIDNYDKNSTKLKADLGFDHGSPYVNVRGASKEVFTVESTVPGGVFGRAGVTHDDIVLDVSILEFYEELESHRGGTYSFTVVTGGDGPDLNKRPQRKITMKVPPKR